MSNVAFFKTKFVDLKVNFVVGCMCEEQGEPEAADDPGAR